VKKILLTLAFLAAVLNAVSPDRRAGLWQTSVVIDGVSQNLKLSIETHIPIDDGEPTIEPIYGLGSTGCDAEALKLAQFRISFRCVFSDATFHDFEGTFNPDYGGISGTWHLRDKKEVAVRYRTRPRSPRISSVVIGSPLARVGNAFFTYTKVQRPSTLRFRPIGVRG
jgi:hypothetical protein